MGKTSIICYAFPKCTICLPAKASLVANMCHARPLCVAQVSVAESSGLEASFVQHVLEGCLDCVCVKKKGRTLTMFRWAHVHVTE